MSQVCRRGSREFAAGESGARGSTACALVVAAGFSPLAIGGGCTLYPMPVLVALSGTTTASGTASTPLPIPSNPALLGLELWVQYVNVDPAGAFQGLASLSDCLHVLVGK